MYHTTESAEIADLILPAAGWGEKDGVFINSERRIGRTRKVCKAPGQALSDFNIFRLVTHHWGCGDLFAEWSSPESVFQILKRLSAGQPCDFTGIEGYDHLDREGGIQWPLKRAEGGDLRPEGGGVKIEKQRRLFEDGKFDHADGKARFLFEAPRAMPEPPNAEYPFILLTGRGTSSQWHTQTRTSKSDVLRKLYPQNAYVEINPVDAKRLGIAPDDQIKVSSRRGEATVKAVLLASVQPGQLFMPMHYASTNYLTADAFDPYSRQPSYKACAVSVSK
jgi:ferredoxin-nitrate reductase